VIPNATPPSFHLLAKPTGATCNLDCAYCFFLEKESLYRTPARVRATRRSSATSVS
jgi:sulfatase maturation enzyme AslB (radical SAM superfamily)